jgi:hypothetical protein
MHRRLQVVARRIKQDEVCGARNDKRRSRSEGPSILPRQEPTSPRLAASHNWRLCDFRASRLREQKTVHPISKPLFGAGPFVFRDCRARHREILEPVKKFGARFAFLEVRGDAITNDSASTIFRVRRQGFFVGTRIVHAAVSNLPEGH